MRRSTNAHDPPIIIVRCLTGGQEHDPAGHGVAAVPALGLGGGAEALVVGHGVVLFFQFKRANGR
jgi:hypothetical protein